MYNNPRMEGIFCKKKRNMHKTLELLTKHFLFPYVDTIIDNTFIFSKNKFGGIL